MTAILHSAGALPPGLVAAVWPGTELASGFRQSGGFSRTVTPGGDAIRLTGTQHLLQRLPGGFNFPLTFVSVFRRNVAVNSRVLASVGSGTQRHLLYFASASNVALYSAAGGTTAQTSGVTISDTTGVHFVAGRVSSASHRQIYQDGVFYAANTQTVNTTPQNVHAIGAYWNNDASAAGFTSDADILFSGLWNRALSDAEILDLQQSWRRITRPTQRRIWVPVSGGEQVAQKSFATVLRLGRQRVVQPQDTAQVIDRRVTRAILPQALGFVDLVNGGGITVSGSGFTRVANGKGYGLRNNSLTRANYVNVTKRTEESTSITIVWTGVVHQTGGSTYPFFRSNQTIIHATAATNAMWGCRFGAAVNANSTTPIKLGVPTTYVFTQTGNIGSLFVDGVAALLNVTGGTGAISTLHGIDGNIGFAQSNDITTNAFFILDKGVSIGEARELSLNPWRLLNPVERRIWVPVAAGGGTVTHSLSANAQAQAAATAALDVQAGAVAVNLSAAGSTQSASSASVLKGVSLFAAGLASASSGASMSRAVDLGSAAVAGAASGGALAIGVNLSASAIARAMGAASLSMAGANTLSAAAQAHSSGSAVLSLTISLAASAVAQVNASAQPQAGKQLSASGSASASASASLQVGAAVNLSASAMARASGGATIMVDIPLSASAVADAISSGSLTIGIPLSADAGARAFSSAVVSKGVLLFAQAQAITDADALLSVYGAIESVTKSRVARPSRWDAYAAAEAVAFKASAGRANWSAA